MCFLQNIIIQVHKSKLVFESFHSPDESMPVPTAVVPKHVSEEAIDAVEVLKLLQKPFQLSELFCAHLLILVMVTAGTGMGTRSITDPSHSHSHSNFCGSEWVGVLHNKVVPFLHAVVEVPQHAAHVGMGIFNHHPRVRQGGEELCCEGFFNGVAVAAEEGQVVWLELLHLLVQLRQVDVHAVHLAGDVQQLECVCYPNGHSPHKRAQLNNSSRLGVGE